MDTCAHCKHYRASQNGRGLCAFNPPTAAFLGFNKEKQSVVVSFRPEVAGNEAACGRYEAKVIVEASATDRKTLKL